MTPRTVLWLALGALVACASAPAATPSPAKATSPAPPAAGETEVENPAEVAAREAADLEERLAYLTDELEKARDAYHLPGFAVAVVKGDEILMARGFGVRDEASGEPVTEETIFAIGSATKAMTATTLAMLVGEGKLDWDDPVRKHLPELDLAVTTDNGDSDAGDNKGDSDKDTSKDDAAAEGAKPVVTLRDLLTHRTGFPRMNLLWASGKLSADEIFAYASKAEPTKSLRAEFQYNNVQYLAAGQIAGRLAGSTWAELIETRLFGPLGMKTSHALSSAANDDPRRATGYMWLEQDQRLELENHRILDVIAPAGAVYSNVVEMSRWLRLLLGRGVFDGKRLVDEKALAETQKPQIEIGPGVQYGLGWMIRDIGGHRVIEHGGNIDGYSSSVGFFPDDGIGFVMLSNLGVSPLQSTMPSLVHDAMLGDAYRRDGPTIDFSRFEGRYEADMGPLAGQMLTVEAKDGVLTVDVPGQMVFELHPPDESGKWFFKMTDTIAVSFVAEKDKPATAMRLHQAGFDFELPREGQTFPMIVDADAVAPLLGRYKSTEGQGAEVTVEIYRGRLTVVAPGPLRLQLDGPSDDGVWQVRARDGDSVRFEVKDGRAMAVTMMSGEDDKERRLERVEGGPEPATLADVLKVRKPARRQRALERAGLIVATGTARQPQSGISGKATLQLQGLERFRIEVDFGKAGAMTTVVTPDGGWEMGDFDEAKPLEGAWLAQARTMHPLALHGDWSKTFSHIEFAGTEERDGKLFFLVELGADDLPRGKATVDAATGDVVAFRGKSLVPIGEIPVSIRFEEFRAVGGLRIPFRTITEEFQSGHSILELERVKPRQRSKRGLFPPKLPTTTANDGKAKAKAATP